MICWLLQSMFEINFSVDGGNTFFPAITFSDDTAPSGSLYTLSYSSPNSMPSGTCCFSHASSLRAAILPIFVSLVGSFICDSGVELSWTPGTPLVMQFVYKTNNPKAPAAFYQCADIQVL
jgi:hypothetical protein